MRLPDRPRTVDQVPASADGASERHPASWYAELRARLERLPDAHPSAVREPELAEPPEWRRERGRPEAADGREPDDRDGDDGPAGDPAGTGGSAAEKAEATAALASARQRGLGVRSDRAADAGWLTRVEPGGPSVRRGPYRPWFGADGATDPWFAPGPTS